MTALGKALLGVVAAAALACVGAGIFLIVQRETGVRARAEVTNCVESGGSRNHRTDCTGTWVVGGSLADGGRVVVGTVEGADSGDVGKTIDVTVSGDHAYARSLTLPIVLIALGLAFPALAAASLLRARRIQRRARMRAAAELRAAQNP
ncbi:MAG TPA: hypothetical protein VGM80_15015 [Gaiellaceae bacterium]